MVILRGALLVFGDFLCMPVTYSLSPDFRATNVPHPGDAVTSPRRLRSCTARAAVDDATPNSSASGTAPGSRVPGGYVPSAIRCSRIAAICGHAGRVGSSSMAIKLGRLTDRCISTMFGCPS